MSNRITAAYREQNWDWYVAIPLILLGMVGLRMVNSSELWNSISRTVDTGIPIGTLFRRAGGVRFHPAGNLLWHDVADASRQEVHNGDTIYTGPDGTAKLTLDRDGSTLEIQPNSLIVVQIDDDDPSKRFGRFIDPFFRGGSAGTRSAPAIEVKQGNVKFDLKSGDSALKVTAQGKSYSVSSQSAAGGQFDLSVAPDQASGVRFSTEKSAGLKLAEAGVGKPAVALLANDQVRFGKDGKALKTSFSATLEAPAESSALRIDGTQAQQSVRFQWKWTGAVPAAADASGAQTLELLSEANGAKALPLDWPVASDRSESALSLPEGAYRWRVKRGGYESGWSRFKLYRLDAPNALGPADHAQIVNAKGGAGTRVNFTWDEPAEGLLPELSLVDAKTGKPLLASAIAAGLSAGGVSLTLPEGRYQWSLRATGAVGTSSWSKPFEFAILSPEQAKNEGAHETALLKPGDAAKKSADPALATAVKTPAVAPSRAQTATPATKIEAQALSQVIHGNVKREAVEDVPVVSADPALVSTRLGSSFEFDYVPVLLQWRPVPKAREYEVSIFNRQGRRVMNRKVKEPKLHFRFGSASETSFRYEIEANLADGKKAHSGRIPITIQLSPPIPKFPAKGAVTGDTGILLTWERTSLTTGYRIQIATDPAFEFVVTDQKAEQNLFASSLPTPGHYYWRVRSLSGSQESVWSEAGDFIFKPIKSEPALSKKTH